MRAMHPPSARAGLRALRHSFAVRASLAFALSLTPPLSLSLLGAAACSGDRPGPAGAPTSAARSASTSATAPASAAPPPSAAASAPLPSASASASAASRDPVITLTLTSDPSGSVKVTFDAPFEPMVLAKGAKKERYREVVGRALAAFDSVLPKAVIVAGPDTPYEVVQALLAALRDAQITEIALQPEPKAQPKF